MNKLSGIAPAAGDIFLVQSIFRNPEGESAGRLIDCLGLKGLRRGEAQVSTIHGNFIINRGAATPGDILGLMDEVRARVFEDRGLTLEPELRLIA